MLTKLIAIIATFLFLSEGRWKLHLRFDGNGRLKWFRHNGSNRGAGLEDPSAWSGPKDAGWGWAALQHVFPGGNGVINTIADDGDLRWRRHNAVETGAGLDSPGA
jgi:hypothetical protein